MHAEFPNIRDRYAVPLCFHWYESEANILLFPIKKQNESRAITTSKGQSDS